MLCIGISSTVKTADILCVIICIVLGTMLGELLNIEGRLDGAGKFLRRKLIRGTATAASPRAFHGLGAVLCGGHVHHRRYGGWPEPE